MKYKKGDKVEVVEFISSVASEHGANIGDIGVVDIASDVGDGVPYFVKLDAIKTGDNGLWFSEEGIKLVEEDVENKVGELKAGDKVILTNARADNAQYYNLKEGIKGTVRENDGGTYNPILVDFEEASIWINAGDLQLDVVVEKEKIETCDIVRIVSKKNTTDMYDWNKNMKQVGESMKVDGIYGVTVENDIFVYHIDDLVLLRKGDSDVIKPYVEKQDKPVDDVVNKPKHYTSDESGVECIDITKNMSFVYGNVLKYCWRVGKKDDDVQELSKALWYSEFGINNHIPIFISETSLEDEKNIHKVLKFSKGWKYVLLNAIYWNDKEEVNRAVKGLLEDING
ncbi:protein of unknown function DUF3310 [Acinetobacter phage Phab24]|nr:protein of unknown function DUF3310 [Acinetobacter phage Phab24]